MKKLLAGVLAGITILSCTSITAFANEEPRPPQRYTDGIIGFLDVFDENGAQVMMTEEDQIKQLITDTLYTDQKVYLSITPLRYHGRENYEIDMRTGENSKYIKSIKLVDMKLKPGTEAYESAHEIERFTTRPFVEVTFNDIPSDEEVKVKLKFMLYIKRTSYAIQYMDNENEYPSSLDQFQERVDDPMYLIGVKGDTQLQKFDFFLKSRPDGQDGSSKEFVAGAKVYTKPVKNEENEVVWTDANRDLAKTEFIGDSATKVYYPKLTTTWDNAVYHDYFSDVDAYKFEFVATPTLSTTSRVTLDIYNPFFEDYEYTVNAEDLYVYQLINDEFVDVTKNFKPGVDDEDRQILSTKTRQLGYYVISNGKISA